MPPEPIPELSTLRQVSAHCFVLPPDSRTDRPALGAVVGKRNTLMVEGGNSLAHVDLFLRACQQKNVPQPGYVVITHWHWDHIFGAAAFDVPILSTTETRRITTWMASLDWSDKALDRRVEEGIEIAFCRDNIKAELPDRRGLVIKPPSVAFTAPVQVDLGEVICHLVPVGGDHSPDSCVVYVPEDKVLFLGDCIYPDLYNGPDNYTTAKLFPLLDLLLSYNADLYIPAHQPDPIPRRELVEYAALLKAIGTAVETIGPNREALLTALAPLINDHLDDDPVELLDAFLAGLVKPIKKTPYSSSDLP